MLVASAAPVHPQGRLSMVEPPPYYSHASSPTRGFLPLSQCMMWASGNDLQQRCHNLDRLPVLLSVQTDRGCARQPWHLWAGSHNVTASSLKNQQTGTMFHFTRLLVIQWFIWDGQTCCPTMSVQGSVQALTCFTLLFTHKRKNKCKVRWTTGPGW